jgi:hypothetical protein|tara:strand:+ start:7158 stop:7295 length:138 start_codon:yes stop_codon:yes gene_type:complete
MIKYTLELLKIARSEKWSGQYIDVALGKNKMPESFKELKQKIKRL